MSETAISTAKPASDFDIEVEKEDIEAEEDLDVARWNALDRPREAGQGLVAPKDAG